MNDLVRIPFTETLLPKVQNAIKVLKVVHGSFEKMNLGWGLV